MSQAFPVLVQAVLPYYYLGKNFYIFPFVPSQISSSLMQQVPNSDSELQQTAFVFFCCRFIVWGFFWGGVGGGRGGIIKGEERFILEQNNPVLGTL